MNAEGWPYVYNRDEYLKRDRALLALLYVGALRISEALRLKRSQFHLEKENRRWVIRGVKLSKERLDRPRRNRSPYREVWLPLKGERAPFTNMIMNYAVKLPEGADLFPFRTQARAFQIVQSLTGADWDEQSRCFRGGLWCHYLRAQGERYLYRGWNRNLFKVASYVRVTPKTLIRYLESEDIGDMEAI